MTPIIRVDHLRHVYSVGTPFEKVAIDDIDLAIPAGQFVGIIGHTGSGKSTLIQHLNGLLKPTSGRILLGGEDIWADPKKIRDVRFRVGLVFQYPEYQLFEETVYRDIAFGPTNMGLSKDEIDRRVRESAHFAGVTDDLLEKSPFALSGGQKRRVAIAGVIAMEPEVLVLDEPSAGLDPQGREELLANIREFHRARGTTVVLVSHSMEEIARNVDRIVVLSDGKVYMEGTPKQVFARAHELEQVGLDVPQVTKVAAALKARGLDIDTAVYTVEALEQKLLTLRGGASPC
jgi:energy-coupling factor transport system ATP-binding protein